MAKVRKIIGWGGAALGVIIVLAAALALVLPRVLDMDAIGRNVAAVLDARYHVRSERIEIAVFPHPRLIIHGTRVTIPETLTASAEWVAISPKILPLFTGRFVPAEIDLRSPKVIWRLAEPVQNPPCPPLEKGGIVLGLEKGGVGEQGDQEVGLGKGGLEEKGGQESGLEKGGLEEKGGRESAVEKGGPKAGSEKSGPEVGLEKGGKQPEASEKITVPRLSRLKEKLAQLQGAVFAAMPGIVIDVDDGGLDLYSGQERVFSFGEIDLRATVHAHGIDLELTGGKSDLWAALSFSGWVDPNTLKSAGELNLTGGTPRGLIQYFFPAAACGIGDSQVDLSVSLSTSGPHGARADFTASVPQFEVVSGDDHAALQNGSLTGSFLVDSDKLDISLSQFRFDYPRVSITGRYLEKFAEQSVSLDLDGRDTDAATVRRVLLAVDKENRTVKRIFDIIREGEVPEILFSARVKSPSDLKKLPNYTIKGSIRKGVIFAPKAELLVSNVSGEVNIAEGILEGTGLCGNTAGTSTSGGQIRIGLHGSDAPFHLDLPLDADLRELPPVLERVVKNEAFKRELAQIKDVTGRTKGRLVLGEALNAVKVKVETGPFQLAGRYERLPDPIEVEGAFFTLDGSKVVAGSLTGSSGRNRFTRVGLSFDWGGEKVLEVDSPVMAVLSMELVDPFLLAQGEWKKLLDGNPKGALIFNSLEFRGPIGDRSKWDFQAMGSVEDVTFQNRQFTGPVALKSGSFEMSPEVIILKEINAVLADSSITLSGKLSGYLEKLHSAELSISGKLGPEGNRNAAALANMPPALRAISNLALTKSRLVWEKGVRTGFEGEMQLAAGPRVSIRLVKTPEELSIDDLVIKDPDSDAAMSLKLRERQLQIKFTGLLSNRTADKLLTENHLLTGPIEGKFNAHLYLDTPKKSTAQGQITISGFQLPTDFHLPARIENATLEADGSNVNVKSAVISWNGSRLSLGGKVLISETAYLVDMNAFADNLDLDGLIKARKEGQPDSEGQSADGGEQSKHEKAWETPLRGTIHLRSERLTYGKFTWNPANADVELSPGMVDVKISQANLCGISTPGRLVASQEGVKMELTPSAKDQDLQPALACLFDRQHLLTGNFTLKGNLSAGAKGRTFAETMNGDIDFKAKDGRIYRYDTFAKLMSLLGITEIYRGVLPDLVNEGCPYDEITVKGKIKGGKLTLSECVVDGPSIKMVFRGEIDLAKKKMDVVALVSPLRTVDRIVGAVPVIGKLLDGAFMSVPVRVVGDLYDPEVLPMSPTAVGEELFGFMKRTFRLPITIIQPLVQQDEAKSSDETKSSDAAKSSDEPQSSDAAISPGPDRDWSAGQGTHGAR